MNRTSAPEGASVLEVDLGALERNLARLTAHLPARMKVIVSVKANGYGHGAVDVSRVARRSGAFAVATASVEEAVAIRREGAHDRILLLPGQLPDIVLWALEEGLIPTIANREVMNALPFDLPAGARAFVKIDAGLGRFGLTAVDALDLMRELRSRGEQFVQGVYTHLPFTDDHGEQWARAGLGAFTAFIDELRSHGLEPPVTQALSSPGIAAGLPNPFTAVCPGRLAYGIAPTVGDVENWGLEPVLRSIRTRLVHVGKHPAGAHIGSGGHLHLDAPTFVGVVPFGIRNGYTGCQPEARVLHHGRPRRVVGVSLEHATLDLGDGPAEVGDEVIFVGRSGANALTLADMAIGMGLGPLEALMRLDGRTRREYVT